MKSSVIKRVVRFAIPVMTVGIFILDWLTPMGAVDWVLYFIPLLLSFYAGGRFSALLLASVFSALTLVGFYLSPPGVGLGIALTNLFLGLFTLWMVAILVERLRRSMSETAKMSAVVEQSPVSIIITDLQGAIEYVNPKFCSVTGYNLEEVQGKTPRLLKSGQTPAAAYRQLWTTISAGGEWRGEFHNRKKNGDFYWESASVCPIRDDEGNITHFAAIKEDITEKKRTAETLKRAEKELAESERLQKAMFDNIPDPVWMRDREGRFLVVNQAWCRFAGISAADAVGKPIAEIASLYSAEGAKSLQTEDAGVISSGKPSQGEIQMNIANHGDIWFETSKAPLLDEQGVPCGVVGIARDITRRKQAEATLLGSKQFLQSTLDALSAHIAILDQQGSIVAVNAAWSQFARQNDFLGHNYGIGANYLSLCESAVGDDAAEAYAVAKGIRDAIAGNCAEFLLEYPCHSSQEQRWFVARVTRFGGEGVVSVVVAHENITARKQAREELQWKTAFLEAQVNSSIDGILVVDEQGRKKLQNQRLTDLLKIPQYIAEDPDAGPQLKWVTQAAQDPEKFIEKVRHFNSHRMEVSRDELQMKDGMILDRYYSPVIGRDGKYHGRMWSFRDITERKRMEESLRKSEEKFRQLADNITDVFWMTSPDLKTIHYVSPSYERIWGRSKESLYANPHQRVEVIPPGDRDRVFTVFSTLMADHPEVSVEYPVTRPDGAVRWIHDRGFQVRDSEGKLVRLIGIASDITERKTLEMKMEQLRTEQEIILDNIGEGLHWIDSEGRIKFENPAAARMLGHEVRELLGQPAHATIHHTQADGSPYPQSECPIDETRRDKAIRRVTDEAFWRKDGTSFPVEYTCTPVYEKDGRSGGTMVIFTDITERKRTQAEVASLERRALEHKLTEEHSRQALEHERELNRIKSQFVSMVSHEFRTPLCVINTAASLMESYSAQMTEQERAEQAGEIERAVARMTQMMEDFLVHEKLQSGKMGCKPSRVNLDAFCRESISEASNSNGAGCRIEFTLDPAAREALLDEKILRHILCNLLSNAVKYSLDQQPVALAVKRVAGHIQINGDPKPPPGDYIELLVRDAGIGIPAADLGKLFQTFHRAANVGNRPGTGMGLAIVKKFVDLHQGMIHIESTEGKGTNVRVWLPVSLHEMAGLSSSAKAPQAESGAVMRNFAKQ